MNQVLAKNHIPELGNNPLIFLKDSLKEKSFHCQLHEALSTSANNSEKIHELEEMTISGT